MNVTVVYEGSANLYNASGNGSMDVMNLPVNLNRTLDALSIVTLFITMISLGCSMEVSKIKAHFLKPKGVAIALLAQFVIMPLTAFSLAKVLQLETIEAAALLICGCCPGGALSNIFTLAVKGDLNLSIVMTTCSCLVGLGMMPLLLFILSHGFPGLENAVPYKGIIITLALTLVPCGLGILINHYKANYTHIVQKAGLGIMIVTGITISALSYVAVKDLLWMIVKPGILSACALMPLTGFTLGYLLSIACRLSPQCSRTVSMETGCQNIQLCLVILKVAFTPQVIGPMFLFPLIYITLQCAEALLLALCFRCYQTVKPPAEGASVDFHQVVVKQP